MGSISNILLACVMDKKLSSERVVGDIERNVWYDEFKDKLTTETVQDIEPILSYNKESRNDWDTRFRVGGHNEWHQAATIPLVIVEKLMKDGTWDDPKRLKKWLNDSDNIMYRTSTSQL